MSQPQLVLASGSPRRRQLLEDAGYRPRVLPARDGVEDAGRCSTSGPAKLVLDLAVCKLGDVVDRLRSEREPLVVLAADTVAECGGQILGKPVSEDHARAMLAGLSGKRHRVYTGVAIASLGHAGEGVQEVVVSELEMDTLAPEWIEAYVESGAWEGKAGGFGLQDDLGVVRVTSGSESNVVGLPMERVSGWLADAGCLPHSAARP